MICRLATPHEYRGDPILVRKALTALNQVLALEGLKVELNGVVPVVKPVTISFDLAPDELAPKKPLPMPNFLALDLEPGVGELLVERWREAQACVEGGAHLAALVMMGGLLEGLLLGACQRSPHLMNGAAPAPRDATGKVKHFGDWTLSQMIDAAHAVGWIDLDVKQFSHALREFRNIIHPYQQMAMRTAPNEDTCMISWCVVTAAANDLARVLSRTGRA